VPPEELRRLVAAVRVIQQEFVTPVENAPLAQACGARMRAAAGQAPGEPVRELAQLPPLLKRLQAARGGDPSAVRLVDECLAGMAGALDGRSSYRTPEELRELTRGSANPALASLGLELAPRPGGPEVVMAFEGAPAARAGIATGDRLVEIDGWPTAGALLPAVVARIQGPVGSSVTLLLEREGVRRTLTVRRELLRAQTVRLRRVTPAGLPTGVWHLAVLRLREETARDVERAAGRALGDGQPAPAGIVLDLRDNPGGLITAMVDLTSAFLREGLLVGRTEGRGSRQTQRFVTKARPAGAPAENSASPERVAAVLRSLPAVVMINGGTTSGAEMVAAALQAHGRGRLVGSTTAGTGAIQTIFPLERGALRLTTAVWHGARDEVADRRPVEPDVTIATARGPLARTHDPEGEDVELMQAIEVLRQALPR